VIERENAEIGVLISMAEPTRDMRKEAASAGFYKSAWGKHPRLQLLTIEELLGGKGIDYPPSEQVNVTLKKGKGKKATPPTGGGAKRDGMPPPQAVIKMPPSQAVIKMPPSQATGLNETNGNYQGKWQE